ncbi:MAG TPA: hypothetical protein VLQ48_16810 [Chloroflexia bacterium]|nr:hypothetical protein [Chloroflexia bacterium]
MNDERTWLSRYLAVGLLVVGGLEWFLGRVVSRFAAAPPLSGIGRTIVETLGRTGFFLFATAFLLATALLLISLWRLFELARGERHADDVGLAIFLALFAVLDMAQSLLSASSLVATEGWLTVFFNLFSLAAVWWLTVRFSIVGSEKLMSRVAVLLAALAYSCWYFSILVGGFALGGVTIGSTDILHVGELAAVVTPVAFFIAVALPDEWRMPKRWIAPVLVGLALAAGNIADIATDSGYTGVFSIWSVGFTLWMPWPIYALSLVLFLYAVLTCFARRVTNGGYANANTGMGMLLILYAGYNLQLTYQHLLAVLAFALLTRVARPFRDAKRPNTMEHAVVEVEPVST